MWTESEILSMNFLYSAVLKSKVLLLWLLYFVRACISYFENSCSLSCRDCPNIHIVPYNVKSIFVNISGIKSRKVLKYWKTLKLNVVDIGFTKFGLLRENSNLRAFAGDNHFTWAGSRSTYHFFTRYNDMHARVKTNKISNFDSLVMVLPQLN